MYLPTLYTPPPSSGSLCCLSAPTRKMRTGDNTSVTLLSVRIDIISSGTVMQPNLKCFYWGDVVFTLTAPAVFPCFRVLKFVMLKRWIYEHHIRNLKSPVFLSCPSLPLLTLRSLTLYIYGAPILDVSRSHTTTQHSR